MRFYFDYASTTPIDPRVLKEMKPYFNVFYGNAGSLHFWGQKALKALDLSREKIAKYIGADFNEIIFTSGATEANNLALRGVFHFFKIKNQNILPKIIVSQIEHESVLETAHDLENYGAKVVYLPVNKYGFVNLKKLKEELDNNTILVSIMYANNEIGTIEPIKKIAKIINDFKKENNLIYPLLHTDASQAFQFLDCNVLNLGVDLMTLSSHKIYGPKGIGALYIKNKIKDKIWPQITGGGQEFKMRSGTENIPSIVGFAKAIELAFNWRQKEFKRIYDLRNYFWKNLKLIFKKIKLNQEPNFKNTLPNILNIYFPGKNSDELITKLDLLGIAVSSGSACRARSPEPSYVLLACGYNKDRAQQSLRFSFGRFTKKQDIDKALVLIKIIKL
jgi:cysteine desulfurase